MISSRQVGLMAANRHSARRWAVWLMIVAGAAAGSGPWTASAVGEEVAFRRIVLHEGFHAEGAALGDLNKDGHGDAVYGPYWYAGPEFKVRHEIYPPEDFDPLKYSNNFFTAVSDVDADGWLDVVVNVWPGKEVVWFRNPGASGAAWTRNLAHPVVDNEAPHFVDVTGDGRPELVFHTAGVLGMAGPSGPTGSERWPFRACSEPEKWGQYQHGLGVGDVNGDGRADLLMAEGWWEQPATETAAGSTPPLWKKHPYPFGKGGAQIHAYDVDGDGDNDVITSIDGHAFGLSWFEQVKKDGEIDFVEHRILSAKPEENLDGVQFSQLHALELIDIDGDGLKDIVTGKRYWAHGPTTDVDAAGPPVLYWFQLTRKADGTVAWTPHRIDDASGVGTQFSVGDINGDGRPDIVIGNKKGGFVFLQERR